MVDRIDPHDRADHWDYSGTGRERLEGRHRRRRGHRGSVFHAYAPLHAQEAVGGNSPQHERYLAKRGRDYEGYRKVGNKTHNNAVHHIWNNQRVVYHDMDCTTDCVGPREVDFFLC